MKNSNIRGMLDIDTLKQMVNDEQIETVLTVFPDIYGRLLGKRIAGAFFLDEVLDGAIHVCNYLLACDMEMDPVPGYAFTSWEKGYGDLRLIPDLKTLHLATWLEKTAIGLCDAYHEEKDVLVEVAPRTILRRQVEKAANQGYIAMGGSELELYVFRDSCEETALKNIWIWNRWASTLKIITFYRARRRSLLSVLSVIIWIGRECRWSSPRENGGPGQQEINLCYADFLEMSDRHSIYKHAAKEIALQQGRSLTFMAKWGKQYAGSSMHLHASLLDQSGINSLFPGEERWYPSRPRRLFAGS